MGEEKTRGVDILTGEGEEKYSLISLLALKLEKEAASPGTQVASLREKEDTFSSGSSSRITFL